MDRSIPNVQPAAAPGWDIAFTRLARQTRGRVQTCVRELSTLLRCCGLTCQAQARQTPRGLSLFVAVTGLRGLLFICDFTLVDGMAVGRHPGAALDVRLLDAHGDVAATCSSARDDSARAFNNSADAVIAAAGNGLSAMAIYLMAMGHFDLLGGGQANAGAGAA